MTTETHFTESGTSPPTWRCGKHPRTPHNTAHVSARKPGGECRTCRLAAGARYRQSEHGRAIQARALWTYYGIDPSFTWANYLRLLVKQGNRCALCKKPPRKTRRLDVDHDHKDPRGRVRGLVHVGCNTTIDQYEAGTLKNPRLRAQCERYLSRAA